MIARALGTAVLLMISVVAHTAVLDEFERALIASDYEKARSHLSKLSKEVPVAQARGYTELLRVFESCEAFISLADQHMIQPSSVPVKKLETAYDAIGFKESDFAVSTAIVDLLNERLQRAGQMMEFANRASNAPNTNVDAQAKAKQDQALRAACGMDYGQLKLGMTLDRVRLCVGTPYLVNVLYRRGMFMQTYKVGDRYVDTMGYQVIGWVR
jgi:hypothetical protein